MVVKDRRRIPYLHCIEFSLAGAMVSGISPLESQQFMSIFCLRRSSQVDEIDNFRHRFLFPPDCPTDPTVVYFLLLPSRSWGSNSPMGIGKISVSRIIHTHCKETLPINTSWKSVDRGKFIPLYPPESSGSLLNPSSLNTACKRISQSTCSDRLSGIP